MMDSSVIRKLESRSARPTEEASFTISLASLAKELTKEIERRKEVEGALSEEQSSVKDLTRTIDKLQETIANFNTRMLEAESKKNAEIESIRNLLIAEKEGTARAQTQLALAVETGATSKELGKSISDVGDQLTKRLEKLEQKEFPKIEKPDNTLVVAAMSSMENKLDRLMEAPAAPEWDFQILRDGANNIMKVVAKQKV